MDREALRAWLRVLDHLTYYKLFGVDPHAGADELKAAFHAFADTFHPDGHTARPRDEREAVARIFRRANEAYRVLTDPALRAHYDASLAEGAPPAVASRQSTMPPPSVHAGPRRLEDTLKSPTARPFARRAEELAKQGDFKQAKLQLTMARHYEPKNAAIEALLVELEAKIKATKK
jgi:DnaJ-class molecular chaperone